ncbi:hypothetical protein JOF42_000366 [Microbacterium phyllosphaerae]|uniref:Uncharacterized protein n=1 Tax=Microbacterium phyllosphaerae TaxID=124798 RepID=A0ABS4WLG6_9MICO|nr:hypothetical protein [Microbacterium phyllosphaerae]
MSGLAGVLNAFTPMSPLESSGIVTLGMIFTAACILAATVSAALDLRGAVDGDGLQVHHPLGGQAAGEDEGERG